MQAHATSSTISVHDAVLLAIFEAPLDVGETIQLGFMRKERELRTAISRLTVRDARELHLRLVVSRPNDVLAAKFAGLVVERRNRLLAFIADAPRRTALSRVRDVDARVPFTTTSRDVAVPAKP